MQILILQLRWTPRWFASVCACAVAATTFAARAGEHPRAAPGPMLPAYQQECGACHIAYPSALLPASSWQRLLADLPHHFGTDASLDAATRRQIADWLGAHAGDSRRLREQPPEDRITRSRWFVREHDELPASTWRVPGVKSAAHCNACHTRADQGDFNEHDVRIPR